MSHCREPRRVALILQRAGEFHVAFLGHGQHEVVRLNGHGGAVQAARLDLQPALGLVPRTGQRGIEFRLVQVQPGRGDDQRRGRQGRLAQLHGILRGRAVDRQRVAARQAAVFRGQPGGQPTGPVLQLSLRLHVQGPRAACLQVFNRLGQPSLDLIVSAFDVQRCRIDPSLRTEIGLAFGREQGDQIVFVPRRLVRQSELEILEPDFGVGVELLLRRAFPVEIAPAFARQLQRAEIDELAELVGQLLEIEAQRGGQVVGRAVGVHLQKIGLALKFVDDRPVARLADVRRQRHRPLPGDRPARGRGGQVVGAQLAVPDHALRLGPTAEGDLHLPRLDIHLLTQPERGGQEPGQSRHVNPTAQVRDAGAAANRSTNPSFSPSFIVLDTKRFPTSQSTEDCSISTRSACHDAWPTACSRSS